MTVTTLMYHSGHFIGAAVLLGTHVSSLLAMRARDAHHCKNITSVWSYRIPFLLQWVWPIPIGLLLFFAPESPWWYVRKDRLRDARRSVERLIAPEERTPLRVDETVAGMIRTNKLEKEVQQGTTFVDLFKGSDR